MHFGRWTDVDGQNIIAQRWPSTADMDLWWYWWHGIKDRYKDGSCTHDTNALLWPANFLILNPYQIITLYRLYIHCERKLWWRAGERQRKKSLPNLYIILPFSTNSVAPFAAPPSSARRWLLPWRGWDARGQSEPKCWDPNGTRGGCTLRVSEFIHSSRTWLM